MHELGHANMNYSFTVYRERPRKYTSKILDRYPPLSSMFFFFLKTFPIFVTSIKILIFTYKKIFCVP